MLNVVTRWSSSISMVRRVVSWYEAINDALFATEKTSEGYVKNKITDEDITLLQQFIEVTDSVYDGTIQLQGSSTPTLSLSLFWYIAIFYGMQRSSKKEKYDPIIQQFCADVAEKMSDKFQWQRESVMVLATILDPRFKNLAILNHAPSIQDQLWAVFKQQYTSFISENNIIVSAASSSPLSPSHTEQSQSSAMQKALHSSGIRFNTEVVTEIDRYKAIGRVEETVDPLQWWCAHSAEYPILSKMARRYLCIPASSAASERAWSALGDIFTKKRNRLKPITMCKLLMVKHNQDALSAL